MWLGVLAFGNGLILGLNRLMIARLGMGRGAMAASFWNHLVGFVFLLVILAVFFDFGPLTRLSDPPAYAYCGGAVGMLIVALASWFTPKIGLMVSTVLVIAGQVLTASVIDLVMGRVTSVLFQIVGVVFIIVGMAIPAWISRRRRRDSF